ncbi:MAG TPA: hypothetical protein VGP92_15380 [Acidimicrobiia bacterium]|nr:hypothetical protein [Acidimicrobiia bacterium]
MADLRTTITEVVTGLGTLGYDDVEAALVAAPGALLNVEPSDYDALLRAWKERRHADIFTAALMNGRAFLASRDGLRGRVPIVVEWKGAHRAPGDEVVPADLRIDHVYLVSCKYLSKIVVNASPHHLFDRLLAGGHGRRGADWFGEVAPVEHARLYAAVRVALGSELPESMDALDTRQRRDLGHRLNAGWPGDTIEHYQSMVACVADVSAQRWRAAIAADAESMLWRLLRIGSAPYFVLGSSPSGFLRLRIATPWDWRNEFELRTFVIEPRPGGQPMVNWRASVRGRRSRGERLVEGHVEIRWSHGRFAGRPEAKVYLDTPHAEVPGYFALA